jgi:4-amino-4-deoxy-L-arabinose transferase-like glycosyltransferase
MWLVLFVTLAHRAGYELFTRERKMASWWWTFYIALAFAFLAKGPIGWTPLLTIILAKRFYPNQKSRLQLIPGITLMLAFVCAWGIPALLRTHGEFFNVGIGKHVVARSFATMEGHGASSLLTYVALLPFYFVTLLASFFPWSIKLSALWKNLRSHCDAVDRFLLTGALIIFGIFTLVQTKLPHYTLPAFPLFALLMAIRFHDLRLSRTLAISAAFNYLVVALVIAPFSTRFFPSYSLARDSERDLQPPMEFGAVGFNEPSLVWYFRKEIRGFMTTLKRKNAAEYMNKPGPRFIVLPTQTASELFPSPDPRWKSYRADGFNFAKGERTDLTLLLKAE